MPSPEVWGPATWTLLHVLAENVNEFVYPRIVGQMFDIIKRICRFRQKILDELNRRRLFPLGTSFRDFPNGHGCCRSCQKLCYGRAQQF